MRILKFEIFEAKYNKNKTTQDYIQEIEDILLEYRDDDLFDFTINPVKTEGSKNAPRSYQINFKATVDMARKHNFLNKIRTYNPENFEVVWRDEVDYKKFKDFLAGLMPEIKSRLAKFNYHVYDSMPYTLFGYGGSIKVIYRQKKQKSN